MTIGSVANLSQEGSISTSVFEVQTVAGYHFEISISHSGCDSYDGAVRSLEFLVVLAITRKSALVVCEHYPLCVAHSSTIDMNLCLHITQ